MFKGKCPATVVIYRGLLAQCWLIVALFLSQPWASKPLYFPPSLYSKRPSSRHRHHQGLQRIILHVWLTYRRSHRPCMAIPQKSFCLLHLYEPVSPFISPRPCTARDPALVIVTTKDCNALSSTYGSRTGEATVHAWQSQKSFCLLHLHFPPTNDRWSRQPLPPSMGEKARDSSSRHHRHRQATHYLPLTYRRSHRPCMAIPQKSFYSFLKFIDGRSTSLLFPSPSPVLVLLQDVCLRGLDEQQFKRGQHCMEPLPSPEKRLAQGKLSLSLQFGRAATLFHSILYRA